jgi:hypothetical protein
MSGWPSAGWFELALLFALAIVFTLTGRLHVALAGPRRHAAFGPLEAQRAAVVGTVWWMVLLTAASTAGFDAALCVSAVLSLLGIALAGVLIRGKAAAFRPVGHPRRWLGHLAPLLVAGLVGLLPVLRHGRFSTENDSLLYCSLAQWYQDHSFRESADSRADQPLAHYAAIYQGAGYPLAPAFLLAGVQASARATSPVLVYPAVSTWGLVLAIGSLLAFGRRALRWPVRWLAPVGLGLAALVQPLTWAHHMGFLAQIFATPLLLTALLLLSQIRSPRQWTLSQAVAAALLAAGLACTYPPFLPLLAGGGLWWFVDRARHRRSEAWRLARWVAMAAAIFGALVGILGENLVAAFGFLRGTLVGGHVDLSPWGFVQATVGAWFWTPFRLDSSIEGLRAVHLWLVPLYLWLVLRGLRTMARDGSAGPLLGCSSVLAVAFVWYGLFARDPWTAERGHSWNLFKLTQWSFAPVVLALVQGAVSLRRKAWVCWLGPALLLVPIILAPVAWSLGGRLGADLEAFVGSSRPLETWDEIRQRFRRPSTVRLLAADTPKSTTRFLPTYLGLLTYPGPLAGEWDGALWVPPDPANEAGRLFGLLAEGEPLAKGEAIAPVVTGLRGLVTDAVAPWGGGIGVVKEPTAPHVLALLNPSDEPRGPGGCLWIGRARTRVLAFSPRELRATLRLTSGPAPHAAERRPGRVVVASQGESREVLLTESPSIDLPILMGRGAGRVEIRFPDESREGADRRRLCILGLSITSGR